MLPAAYAELMPLAARWARPTEIERSEIRLAASAADFASLYEAFMPRLSQVLDLLRNYQLDSMPEDVRYLFDLTCAFAEAAPHHELYGGSADVPNSFDAKRVVPAHTAFAI
jgi:hypothetical protein